jgi:catechol 2,3-dioxygenase-like lactoylglutathione lyase family enzyme
MRQSIGAISLLVRDYDEAITFYVDKLGFDLIADSDLGDGKRWVLVGPKNGTGAQLLLAKAVGPDQCASIGHQAGGRVFLFLYTDNFERDYAAMTARNISFLEAPRYEAYGTVAVFTDLYGTKWDLIELKS